jgi:streptogramin lyase
MGVVRMAMMKAALRSLTVCIGLCLTGLAIASPVAFAEGASVLGGTGGSSLGSLLVTPGSPTEGEQLQMQEEAMRSNPEAVAEREASRTEFEGLDAQQAAKVAGEAFPELVDEPAGGPPKLPSGQSITSYLSDNAASVDVGGGKQALIESMAPMAVQTSSGERVPVDLGLRNVGSVFEARTPAVGVQIPKQLGEGVRLPGIGVSLTPVAGGSGSPLGGSGSIVGSSVLYANTQTDMDSLVKPTTAGFEADTLLRSVESPQQLYFRVGMPEGANLVQAKDGSGVVDVISKGTVIATVLPPGARDAAGTWVPVSMSVSGDTLVLNVEDRSAEYQYPIEVDPTFIEEHFTNSGSKRSNWQWETSNSSRFASKPTDDKETKELGESSPEFLETYGTAAYAESEKAYWAYQTQGDSKIYEFTAETEAKNTEDHIESFLELEAKGTGAQESKEPLSAEAEKTAEYARKPAAPICPKNSKGEQECSPTAGGEGNAARFQQSVVNKPTSKYSFSDFLYKGEVYLSEPAGTHSTTKYNTSSSEFEIEVENEKKEKVKQKRKNAYGSDIWLSEYEGALEFIAEDPGIGVSATRLEYESSPGKWEQLSEHNYLTEGNCTGVQCNPKHTELWTLNKRLPNGEDKIRYRAEDAMGTAKHETESLETEGTETVKVDYSKPHGIFISGLPYGNELSEKTYELTAYATDGQGSTVASSGIGSTELSVDGTLIKDVSEETGKNTEGTCSVPKGECTASAKYKIKGGALGAGHHAIVIVAKDRAGNEGRGEETISIRHSTPVPLGPGSVDLESGDFTLDGGDVSLGSGLSVSRVYSSRDLTAGVEGSLLGPQWSLSMGSEETLVELVDHSVLVTSGNGGQTIFAAVLNSKQEPTGKFEAPPGDSNLTMTLEENEKKEELAYYLKDPAVGTSTKFSPSSTSKVWVPTVQEGPLTTDTVSYIYQTVEVGGKKITRPTEELAAHPKVSCSPKMEPGCRALKFTYATKTKSEIGEGPSEWGEYEGRLVKVSYEGYNPATKKMLETPVPVAEYSYDKQGRLRAEWDPRISPALKTTYGYDAEGHVTALNPPGQEPWAFTYGTVAGDAGTGRLLKVTRAPVSAGLWGGALPSNTGAPKLSGTPKVGVRMGVTEGAWSNQPVVYAFQWEDCNSEGKECTTIAGATNENYRPVSSDVGHTLVAQVSATNGGGSVSAVTVASSEVKAYEKTEYALAKESGPAGVTAGPDGNLWFTNYLTHKIVKMTPAGKIEAEYSPAGPGADLHIVAGPGKESALWFTGGEGIGKITTSGTITQYKREHGLAGITVGPDGNLWFVESTGETEYKIVKMAPSGKIEGEYAIPLVEGEKYYFMGGITAGPEKENALWFTLRSFYSGFGRIGKITTSGTITEYSLPFESAPSGLTVGPDGNLWFTEGEGPEKKSWVGKITTSGTATEYALPEGSKPLYITAGSDGNLWFTESGSSKVGKVTTSGAVTEYAQPAGSDPGEITVGPDNNLWFTDYLTNKIGKVVLATATTTEYEYSAPPSVDRYPQVAAGPDGNVWVTDWDTSKIWKMATGGKVEGEYSLPHTSESWESAPAGITPGPEKENALWFTDHDSDKIGKITTSGEIKEYALPNASAPYGIVAGPEKEKALWFTDFNSNKIGRITTTGVIKEYSLLTAESAPVSITLGPDGNLWFAADYTSKIGRITPAGEIKEYALPANSRPLSIVAGSDGNLWFTEEESSRIGKITTSGEITEYAVAKAGHPWTITAGSDGNLWFTLPGNNKIGKITTSGEITEYAQSAESAPWGIAAGPDGNVWFTDYNTGKLAKVTLGEGESYAPQPGSTVDYNVPLGGAGVPTMTESRVAQWGQKAEERPVEATAIFPPDSPQGWPAGSSYNRATIYYLDEQGRNVNVSTPTSSEYGSISTTEYNEFNDVVRTLTPDNRATALEAGTKSEEVASLLSTFKTYKNNCSKESEFNEERESTEPGTRLCETEGPAHAVKYMVGKEQKETPYARSHVRYFYDEKVPSEGPNKESFSNQTFDLMTESKTLTEIVNSKGGVEQEVEPRTTVTSYSGQNNLGWKLREPTSVTDAAESEGAKVTHTTLYYEEGYEAMGQVMETRGPEGSAGNSAHDAKIVYYSEEENKEYTACGKHPEWAGLVCETLPAKQPPETTGVPKLPETTTTYNIWDEPATIVETVPKTTTFGEETRTTKDEYDAAGRMTSSEEISTASTESTDKTLPKVTNVYNEKTGVLEKQSTTVGGKTKTITSSYNTLEQLETYTDADGNVAKFKYGGPEKDGLLEEMSDSSDNGESNQKYTYSETTKQLIKLVDSAAGTFTASYDTEGKLSSEVYPNGMCANYTSNSVGEATHIEYTKTTSCSEKEGIWFSESKVPSVRGETMSRTSTLASEEYTYDTLGRLTEAHETPAGEYCKTRIYAYDEESNRTELKTREPNSKKECATEGGTVEKHTYDEANRLTDSGIAYDPLGNVTKLPAGDAEGHALESAFYVDNAVATQTQNGVTNNYYMDPNGRVRETITGAKKIITHYDGAGEAVAWTCEGAEKGEKCESAKWTRNIPGIDGALTAIQNGTGTAGETPILQLHDLQGDVVATIKDKTGETKLESTYNSTEFGVPNGGKEPPKFAWLGAGGVEKSLASGVITEGATSYVPQTGRALQSEEVAPPGLPDGSGAGAPYIFQEEPWVLQGATREADEAPGLEAQREREAEEAACRANPAACSEDPAWSGDVSVAAAEAVSGALEGIEIANGLGGGEVAEKVLEILAEHLEINWLSQLKAVIQKGIFGYSLEDVTNWAFSIGTLLNRCTEVVEGDKHPHCWLYLPTVVRHLYKGAEGFEIPNFAALFGWDNPADVAVGFCPSGRYSGCFDVNAT